MVKMDLGAHIDGFIAVVAHTHVVGCTKENPVRDYFFKIVIKGGGVASIIHF